MNLQDYFQRIGFTGTAAGDLDTLKSIHQLHPASIPFENIDVLLGDGIDLALESICSKLINRGRGGYCFEQNGLLMEVLQKLGFEVEALMARVHRQQPPGTPAGPKNHMVLRTVIDDKPWLVDVGFGGMVLTSPLQLIPDLPQTTQHETVRLTERPHGYLLEVLLSDQWQPVYQFGTEPQQPVDIEVANWYTSAHPNSKFRHNLMAARTSIDTRYGLMNNRLSVRKRGEPPVQTMLNTDELATALAEHFLLPVQPEWMAVLDRIVSAGI